MSATRIASLADQVIAGTALDRSQAEWLAALGREYDHDLFRAATRIRERFHGNRVRCCSIVAAKVGRCSEDCAFCSQSAHYKTPVQGLTVLQPNRVLDAALEAARNGADSFGIVNSGYAPKNDEVEEWGQVAGRIRKTAGVRACASLGVLSREQAQRLAELGVERSNHNLQTSRRFFPNIIKTHTYDERLATLYHLKQAGISVCSGALFGMGETWADRLDLAFDLREVDPDVVPINFLIPIDGTPLVGIQPLEPMECLKIIAIYRFLLPRQDIKIAGGREVHLRDLQSWIFYAGATSFLIGNYLTTCGRTPEADRQMVRDLGLELDSGDESTGSDSPSPIRVQYMKTPDKTPEVCSSLNDA
ncbi:MAG TPA: biotin synthase BioB [Phycisphaerae bacterium]|jgi:biotin synthase|nr:biotin synthase BioB [Phycisphaerae bacterium]HOL25391.1 biotin synthase BioB [Phycisphaerae bacterium]HPP22067.1 biotin synthase BioB [Phycisphaerae bacterium]HPU31142.1 biotin synthase BioB [Phycisphaerae bacterium]HXK87305.1 biotin synthase BioB [Phycisphaerae bacterium]